MAACGSLSSLFEKPMPENPTLMESLSSWNQIMPKKPMDNSCFTEIFGELHFHEKPTPPENSTHQTPPPTAVDRNLSFDLSDLTQKKCSNGSKASLGSLLGLDKNQFICDARINDSFPLKSSDKLQFCTERIGSESSDDVDDLMKDGDNWSCDHWTEKVDAERHSLVNSENNRHSRNCSDVRTRTGGFPPPISSIGRSGKPCVYFKSYRQNGRFVLREIRIPTQELLHASREDGRLKLQLVHPDEDIPNEDEDDEELVEEEEEEEKTEVSMGNGH